MKVLVFVTVGSLLAVGVALLLIRHREKKIQREVVPVRIKSIYKNR